MDSQLDPLVPEIASEIIHILDNFRIENIFSERILADRGLVQFKMPTDFSLRSIRESLTTYPLAAYTLNDLIAFRDFLLRTGPIDDPQDAESFKQSLSSFSGNLDSIGRNFQRNTGNDLRQEFDYLSRRVQEIKDQLNSLDQIGVRGKAIVNELEILSQNAGSARDALNKEVQKATSANQTIANVWGELQSLRVDQKLKDKQIEEYEARLSEATFKFTGYEEEIKAAILSTKAVTDKADHINGLLKAAEDTVGLKATEGISAAFIAQHKASKENIGYWLFGGILFLIAAAIVTYLLLEDKATGNDWAQVVSRIAVLTILLGGATFCSKQYIRQKSIVEDYAYKVVLSQSIIAFIDQIQSRSQDQVVEYLNKVLTEIHKDPQRPRKVEAEGAFKNEAIDAISKIIDKVSPSR
ncbi:MAG: hypothetical protein J7619_22990 [Dyadobacter sp.]|uniref:hypothetical protein n=1 Tax=Dyadobacter sp. TaxID=1914288 RepID=UPI001B08B944|nr:hypothetical protein [Dyadobacter sp.]MBO9615583.1 hypothetical protein [Dyadobacter sp.]